MSVLNVCFLNGLIDQSQSEIIHNISIVSFDILFQFFLTNRWPLSLETEKSAEINFYFDMGDRNAWLYFSISLYSKQVWILQS